jgi:hypothetical protein
MKPIETKFLEQFQGRGMEDRIRWVLENPALSVSSFLDPLKVKDFNLKTDAPTCIGLALWAGYLDHLVQDFGPLTGFNYGSGMYYFPNPNFGPPIVGAVLLKSILEKYAVESDQYGLIVSVREVENGNGGWKTTHCGLLSHNDSLPLIFHKTRNNELLEARVSWYTPPFEEKTVDSIVYLPSEICEVPL